MSDQITNILEIDMLVEKFLADSQQGISYLHKQFFQTDNAISLQALIYSLKDELRSGCITYINKGEDVKEIYPYLFYIVNAYCKKNACIKAKKKMEYMCPGCSFLGKENAVVFYKMFECGDCAEAIKTEKDPKSIALFKTFAVHNKTGYHCKDCERFIPHPIDGTEVVCPYFDCSFYGDISSLKGMHHPSVQYNPELITLDSSKDGMSSMKDMIADNSTDSFEQLKAKQELVTAVKIVSSIIESQSNAVHYSSSDFTLKHKLLVYKAFANILQLYPHEMVDYLIYSSRSGGFQHKVFQEYIRLLEDEFPIVFKKGGKVYRIESLLDENLDLFQGISTFDAIVNEKLEIKNNTSEFYIGGRKGSIAKPCYIGKILSITNNEDKSNITGLVKEYSFSKIKMKNIKPGLDVTVSHLRIPPHYQMGGMVYINRIRKKIVDKAKLSIQKMIDD
jgi:hypothetical protein